MYQNDHRAFIEKAKYSSGLIHPFGSYFEKTLCSLQVLEVLDGNSVQGSDQL